MSNKLQDKLRKEATAQSSNILLQELMLRSANRIDELEKSRNFWLGQDYGKRMRVIAAENINFDLT